MAQHVKALASKPEDLNTIPLKPHGGRTELTPQDGPLTTHSHWAHTHNLIFINEVVHNS